MNKMTHMKFCPGCQFQHSLSTMENFICNLSIGRYYSSIKCTALYSLTLALLCSILHVLLCLIQPYTDLYYFALFCSSFVLFCSTLALFCSTQLLSEL